ncbi:MAG: AfsR/SARP family transcriptional regulator, partial [Hyphomicrobiaceae bacterium]
MPTRKIGRASGSSSRVEHRTLTITTLGKFACRFGTREIRIASRKSCALLGYLAISRSEAETRERLVGLLWSESEEERARASLRQALHEIREAFNRAGFDGLRADKLSIAFDRTRIEVDLASVLQHAAERRPHPVLLAGRRQIETLLDTFETIDPAFRVWLLATRQSLHDRIAGLLAQALHLPEMDAGGKAEAAQALLNLDPTHEEACRFLIRARVAAGDIGSALRIYKTLWDLLDTEYDIEPSKETQELIAAVKMAQPSDTDARPVSAGNLVPAVGPQPIAIAPILLIPSGKTEPCPLTGT